MIDLLMGLFLISLISALFTTRTYRLLNWYAFNSMSLGVLAIILGSQLGDTPMLVSGGITLVFKMLVIPLVLKNISQKIGLRPHIVPSLKAHYAIILIPTIIVFTFYLVEPITASLGENANYVAISISALFLSFIFMMDNSNIVTKIIGFLLMENALFLLGTTATEGMPMLVELGIFFDLLIAIVVINLLFRADEELNA